MLLASHHTKSCALRIVGDDKPVAARHLMRAVYDFAAALFNGCLSHGDRLDTEIKQPCGIRVLRRLLHDGAEAYAAVIDEVITAHRAHRHAVFEFEAEVLRVELLRTRLVRARQFVPAHALRGGDIKHIALRVGLSRRRNRRHHVEGRAHRVGDHRNRADWQIHARHQQSAAIGLDGLHRRINVGDVQITQPGGARAMFRHVGRQREHTAVVAAIAAANHAVIHAALRIGTIGDVPAHYRAVEFRGRRGVAGHQFVPDETPGGAHCKVSLLNNSVR